MQQLRIFARNLQKSKTITLINFAGLTLAMLCTLLILEYVFYERSYDRHQTNAQNVYRIAYDRYGKTGLMYRTANYYSPSGPYLKKNFTEVVDFVTITRNYDITISRFDSYGNQISFNEYKTYYAFSSFFQIFSVPILSGDANCLDQPNTVAISERAARKYFGYVNPVGKTITVNGTKDFRVTAIYKNIPENSHLRSDFMFSLQIPAERVGVWRGDLYHNYIQLKPGVDYSQFAKTALTRMIKENYEEDYLKKYNWHDNVYLQPIPDIHLNSNIEYETDTPGNAKIVNILFWFSLFFMLIAWINYTNLTTAQAMERGKETGIRKVSGAAYNQLIIQFLSESFVFNIACLGIAVGVFALVNSYFTAWLSIPKVLSFTPMFYQVGSLVFIVGVLISGFYPAFVLSSYKPASVLKGKFQNSSKTFALRKVLLTIQFIVSLVLITGTIVAFAQVNYLLKKDTGINYRSKLVVKAPRLNMDKNTYQDKVEALQNELIKSANVQSCTFTSDIPGQDIMNFLACYRKGYSESDREDYFRTDIDYNYASFFNVKLVAGRFFNRYDRPSYNYALVNMSAVKRLKYNSPQEAINKVVVRSKNEMTIIGVINDFNYTSVKIAPVPTFFIIANNRKQFICLGFEPTSNTNQLISKVEQVYHSVYPGSPFDYFFLEDNVATAVRPDKTFAVLFGVFSILAIVVALIGILGLVMITINRSVKQMGIRKVLGAKVPDLLKVLSAQFVWPFTIAVLVSVPVSVFGFQRWLLNSYVYHIDINWLYIAAPILMLAALVGIVIYLMTLSVSKNNPVESLRYE